MRSSHCTRLSFTSDRMCHRCRDISNEPVTRAPLIRLYTIGEKEEVSAIQFTSNNVQEVLTSIEEKGIYCADNHPGEDIILGCAELYREGKLTKDDFFHKI